jgi:ribosomal protein S18 acetylase RimI-like enzyme
LDDSIEISELSASSDLHDLVGLSRKFFAEYVDHHDAFFEFDALDDDAVCEYFRKFAEGEESAAFVARIDNRTIAYITINVVPQEPHWRIRSVGNISGLMVHRDFRRRGIATELLRCAMDFFDEHGVEYYTVYTASSNSAGVNFYERAGLERLRIHFLGRV